MELPPANLRAAQTAGVPAHLTPAFVARQSFCTPRMLLCMLEGRIEPPNDLIALLAQVIAPIVEIATPPASDAATDWTCIRHKKHTTARISIEAMDKKPKSGVVDAARVDAAAFLYMPNSSLITAMVSAEISQ